MEDTQVIDWEVDEEEEAEQCTDPLGCRLEPLGRLHLFSSAHGPEKDFPLYLGKNVVGRMPDCSVALPFPSISKQHAVIEILASDKAPVLRDCGSLNGTQTLRPPKVLRPGVSHRLRDQELILFADLPCQYHRLDVPLPFVSRGPLAVEETPRVQAGARPQGLLLAEDSEEEVDFLSERCVLKESRPPSSPLATVVPESDEEGTFPAPDGPGPPFAFNLESDTDEEGKQPAPGDATSAARRDAPAEADGVAAELHLEKSQPSVKDADNETKIEHATECVVRPTGVILERGQPVEGDSDTDVDADDRLPGRPAEVHLERGKPSASAGSDTDVEEDGVPATPAVVPVKKRQIFRGAGTESPGAPALAYLQESQAGGDAEVEKGEAPPVVPQERSHPPVVIDSDTDDEEEVSVALALSLLKESRTVTGSRDADVEEGGARPVTLPEQSQTFAGKDSDTDMEEEGPAVGERQSVPKGHTDKDGALIIARSGKSHPPLGDSDMVMVVEKGSPGVHLERSHASTMVDIDTEVEGEVPAGPAATHLEKPQVASLSLEGTNYTDVGAEGSPAKLPVVHAEEAQLPPDCGMDAEKGMSLAASDMADVRKSQLPAEGDAGTEWAAAVLEQERTLEAGAQGGSPVAQEEQDLLPVSRESLTDVVVGTGTPGEPTQPHREGAQTSTEGGREPHVHETKDSEDNHDDCEDLDLQATQCFVERENQSLEAVQDVEDEPTQAFPVTLPQEAGPSLCSFHSPGSLDEPWEVLATQPFCQREAEASEAQHIATPPEVHGACPSPPRAAPQDPQPESPVRTEPLGIQIRGVHTVGKDMGIPQKTAERVTSEREPLERETKRRSPGEGELTRGTQKREQQPLAGDSQRQESDENRKSATTEGDMESLKVETETSKEIQEKEVEETLGSGVIEKEAERPAPESGGEPAGLEGKTARAIVERGAQVGETEPRSQDQKGQVSFPTAEPAVGPGTPQGLAAAPVTSGGQSGAGRAALVSSRRQRRGHSSCKMPRAEKTCRGEQEPAEAGWPPSLPEASDSPPNPPKPQATSQSQKQAVPQPLLPPLPIPRTRRNGSPGAPEIPPPSETEPLHPEPRVRPRGSSRVTPSPVSPTALELCPATLLTQQPASPEPAPQATRGRSHRPSVKTPAPVEPTAPELQSASPEPASRATRGRSRTPSVKTPVPVEPIAPELQSASPEPAPRATRGRSRRPSVKTPVPLEPTAPEPAPQATRGRSRRPSVKIPVPLEPTAPEPAPRATRGQSRRPSVKTSVPLEPTAPEPVPRATRGTTRRSSVKTLVPVEPTAPERQPPAPTDQPSTPEPMLQATRGSTRRSSEMTLAPVEPTAPKPAPRATRGSTRGSSVKTPAPVEPTAPERQPPAPTDQPVTPESVTQVAPSRTLRSSSVSAVPAPTAPGHQPPAPADQPPAPERVSWASGHRRQRATKEGGSLASPTAHEPCSTPPGSKSCSSRSRRQGTVRAAESFATIPEPSFPQLLEAPTHAPQLQKAEAADTSGSTPESQPKASQSRKKPFAITDSGLLQKRPRGRAVLQKTEFLKEEEETTERPRNEEDGVIPASGKRKRGQAEGEPEGAPSRSFRRAKANRESTAPRVLFTGVVDARAERAVLALGGGLASSVAEASHLVTDRIRRTVKFLCALGRGIPILTLDWLHQSRKAGCFLPPDEYVVSDPEQERSFGFSLRDALSRARQRRLLEGYEVHVTPGVQPPPLQMGEIISCCGGTVLPSMPRSYKPQRVVITCSQDFPRCALPLRAGLPLLSPEFLLTGVLKQEAKPEAFILSTGEVPST